MKRKLVAFLMSMCLLFPTTFILSACGNNEEPPANTETGTGVGTGAGTGTGTGTQTPAPTPEEVYISTLQNLDAILNNATLTITPTVSYKIIQKKDGVGTSAKQTRGGEAYNIAYKIVGDNLDITLPNGAQSIKAGNVAYSYTEENWTTIESFGDGYVPFGFEESTKMFDVCAFVENFGKVATFYNDNAITVVNGANNTKTLTVTFSAEDKANALITSFNTNHDKPIVLFLNDLLSSVCGNQVDIMETLNTFCGTMDNETTVGDAINVIATKLGVTSDQVISALNKTIDFMFKSSSSVFFKKIGITGENLDEIGAGTIDNSEVISITNEMLQMPILPMINEGSEPGNEVTGEQIAQLVAGYISNVDTAYTIDDIINSYLNGIEDPDEKEEIQNDVETIKYVLSLSTVSKCDLSIVFTLDEQGKPTALKLVADTTASMVEDAKNSYTIELVGTLNVAITNVGTTVVSGPTTGTVSYMDLYVGLTAEEFASEVVTKQVTATITSTSFDITFGAIPLASFNAETKVLTINVKNIKDVMEALEVEPETNALNLVDTNTYHSVIITLPEAE